MRDLLRALMAAAILFVLPACQASQAPRTGEPREAKLPSVTAASSPSSMPSPACDPVDEVFAAMFVGVSEAALANAGIAPDEFFTALAGNRSNLELYLEALDIPVDEEWIDAAMSANLGQHLLRDGLDDGSSSPGEGEWIVCE